MAKATSSISSSKREAERAREHRCAVIHLARYRARREVEGELRSKGIRVTLVRPAEISAQARDYLAQHRERLMAEAEQAIATSPLFARWRTGHTLEQSVTSPAPTPDQDPMKSQGVIE
jgi:hypothetical protein